MINTVVASRRTWTETFGSSGPERVGWRGDATRKTPLTTNHLQGCLQKSNFLPVNFQQEQNKLKLQVRTKTWQTSAPVTSSPLSKAPTVISLPGAAPTATQVHGRRFGVANSAVTTAAITAILPSHGTYITFPASISKRRTSGILFVLRKKPG